MFSVYEFAALGAAFCWAIGAMLSQISSQHLGTWAFNRYRMIIASALLMVLVLALGNWRDYDIEHTKLAMISGMVGIFFGDAVLFASFARLGARRAGVLFATNAPMTVILGYIFLGESLSAIELIGIGVTFFGVVLAIVFGKRKSQISKWEEVSGPLWIGITLALLGALGQATGSIIARPVMEANADPLTTSLIRVTTAAAAFWILAQIAPKMTRPKNAPTLRIIGLVTLQASIGMVLGMTLLLFAFSGARAGIAATLSAIVPVLILPLLWYVSKERPALGAWVGALLVMVGTSLIAMG